MSVKEIVKNLGGVISKNSPVILTSLSCAGVFTTAILAVKSTPKAMRLIESKEYELTHDQEGVYHKPITLSKRDIVKTTWKCYIPAAIVGTVTVGCIIGSNTISNRRNAALSALYTLSETAFREYQTKVVEEIGKTKETKIREEVVSDKIKNNPPSSTNVLLTGKGEVLCYDTFTGRYFKSDIEKIHQSINEIDRRLRDEMWVSLNDLYYELGLNVVDAGDLMGFNVDKGWVDMEYSSHLSEDNTPCLALNYKVYPRYDS